MLGRGAILAILLVAVVNGGVWRSEPSAGPRGADAGLRGRASDPKRRCRDRPAPPGRGRAAALRADPAAPRWPLSERRGWAHPELRLASLGQRAGVPGRRAA